MLVTSLSGVATATAPADESKAYMNYNSFLMLLIATMKNQDPTQPNDPSQTMSQLASFSGVEQSMKLNAKLDTLLSIDAGGQATSLIGKTVTAADGAFSGKVESVEISDLGLIAKLDSGGRVLIGPGVILS